jgi:hypothetical protein
MAKKLLNSKTATLDERGDDLNETPAEAVTALLGVEKLPEVVWEPACGPGAIVRVLRGRGHVVYGTDLNDYRDRDHCDQDQAGWDFFKQKQLPLGARAIITNPPFQHAARFAAHAINLCPQVFLLLRLAFLEAGNDKTDAGRARLFSLDGGHLARVHVFRNRLPMMHRDGWEGNKVSNPTPYAWFVFEHAHKGAASIDRISTWGLEE